MNPTFNWLTLAPVLLPAIGAVGLLLLDIAFPRLGRLHWIVAAVLLVVGAAMTAPVLLDGASRSRSTLCTGGTCWYSVDHVGVGLQLTALLASACVALLAYPIRIPDERAPIQAALLLASTAGATAVAGAHDLGSFLVALEIATLPTIALVVMRARRSAIDAGLNFLATSLVSFAVLAMGAGLWFAATGTARLESYSALQAANDPDLRRILVLAIGFIIAGLAFKLSLAPFHLWTPEAVGAASVPMGLLISTTSKVAGVAGFIAVLRTITDVSSTALISIGAVAVLSMTVGNVMALRENGALRFLAWSTVAQAGWIILPFTTASADSARRSAQYLAVYVLATVVAFAVITAIAHAHGRQHVTELSSYGGLLRRHPFLGCSLVLALLTFAGLPPAIAGLSAKIIALQPVAIDGLWLLAILAAVNAMLGVAVYLRWIRIMLGASVDTQDPDPVHPLHTAVVAFSVLVLIAVSLAPQAVFGLFG